RADAVRPVAKDVRDLRLGVGERERSNEVRELRCLLHRANRGDEAEATRDGEGAAQPASMPGGRESRKFRNRSLDGCHLAEVDEAWQRPDCAREERCPRAWRPEDENEPIVGRAEARAGAGA